MNRVIFITMRSAQYYSWWRLQFNVFDIGHVHLSGKSQMFGITYSIHTFLYQKNVKIVNWETKRSNDLYSVLTQ